jgi:ribosomal protein S18 acetylase RimI-like enzyme
VIRELTDAPADVAVGLELVREYVIATAAETGHDVELILPIIPELHDFAGWYLRRGAFLIAETDGIAGGVGVTPRTDGLCEMNRLWIRPGFRRIGLARTLCEASLDAARALGFRRMALDVVPERTAAIALYRSLGFTDSPPIHEYPFAMIPLARDLDFLSREPLTHR